MQKYTFNGVVCLDFEGHKLEVKVESYHVPAKLNCLPEDARPADSGQEILAVWATQRRSWRLLPLHQRDKLAASGEFCDAVEEAVRKAVDEDRR